MDAAGGEPTPAAHSPAGVQIQAAPRQESDSDPRQRPELRGRGMSARQAASFTLLLLAGVRRVSLGGAQIRPGWTDREIGSAGRVGGRKAGAASVASRSHSLFCPVLTRSLARPK